MKGAKAMSKTDFFSCEEPRHHDWAEAEGREEHVRCYAGPGEQGGVEDGQVRHPAARHAQAEAQARDPGREEDDVRKGSKGRRQEGLQGGEGFRRKGLEEFHLSSSVRGAIGCGRWPWRAAPDVVLPRGAPPRVSVNVDVKCVHR